MQTSRNSYTGTILLFLSEAAKTLLGVESLKSFTQPAFQPGGFVGMLQPTAGVFVDNGYCGLQRCCRCVLIAVFDGFQKSFNSCAHSGSLSHVMQSAFCALSCAFTRLWGVGQKRGSCIFSEKSLRFLPASIERRNILFFDLFVKILYAHRRR